MPSTIARQKLATLTVLAVAMLMLVGASVSLGAEKAKPKVRISAWYWLNAAPKDEWERDFKTMRGLGFTHVVLAWGLDAAGVVTRPAETKQAMQWAGGAGLGAYLIVWHPEANSLKREERFMRVDVLGKPIESFDVFNSEWRSTHWKSYLQAVAKAEGEEPAMAGYVFDDSFAGGDGGFGSEEVKAFGMPRKPSDPKWEEWQKARQAWWEDWAKDTVPYIRAVDSNANHEIYLEDYVGSIINTEKLARMGLDFNRVAQHFDAVGGYSTPYWTSAPDSDRKVSQSTIDAIAGVRRLVGPKQRLVYTFWCANYVEERKPGPAVYPTAAQIRQVCNDALKLGVSHLDMYGYRIGEFKATKEEKARMMPAEPAPFVVTGQFPQKFLWDREGLHAELGAYLRGLNGE